MLSLAPEALKTYESPDHGFGRIRDSNLNMKWENASFGVARVEVLVYVISKHGVEPDLQKIKYVSEVCLPQSKKELNSFLLFCSFNRRFVRGVSLIAVSLHEMTAQEAEFQWTEGVKSSFNMPKDAKSKPPVLAFPD